MEISALNNFSDDTVQTTGHQRSELSTVNPTETVRSAEVKGSTTGKKHRKLCRTFPQIVVLQ